jgi:hypothetical protein
MRLALLYISKKQYGEAIGQLRAAAEADPDYCRQHLPGLMQLLYEGRDIDDGRFWKDLAVIGHGLGLDEVAAEK